MKAVNPQNRAARPARFEFHPGLKGAFGQPMSQSEALLGRLASLPLQIQDMRIEAYEKSMDHSPVYIPSKQVREGGMEVRCAVLANSTACQYRPPKLKGSEA